MKQGLKFKGQIQILGTPCRTHARVNWSCTQKTLWFKGKERHCRITIELKRRVQGCLPLFSTAGSSGRLVPSSPHLPSHHPQRPPETTHKWTLWILAAKPADPRHSWNHPQPAAFSSSWESFLTSADTWVSPAFFLCLEYSLGISASSLFPQVLLSLVIPPSLSLISHSAGFQSLPLHPFPELELIYYCFCYFTEIALTSWVQTHLSSWVPVTYRTPLP